jgi:hypothetical protein
MDGWRRMSIIYFWSYGYQFRIEKCMIFYKFHSGVVR